MNVRRGVVIVVLSVWGLVGLEVAVIHHMHKSIPFHLSKSVPQPRETADEAAIDVFTYIYTKSHSFEYAGVILKWPGGLYMASLPQTELEGTSSSEDMNSEDYPGARVQAGYHSHPCIQDAYTYAFSPEDIYGARKYDAPEYMADFCTGDIHYWAPGDKLDSPVFGVDVMLATGKIVGHIKVDGVVLQ